MNISEDWIYIVIAAVLVFGAMYVSESKWGRDNDKVIGTILGVGAILFFLFIYITEAIRSIS